MSIRTFDLPEGSIPEAIIQRARAEGDRPALLAWHHDAWRHVTFAELAMRLELVARALVDEGLKPGDRVGLLGHNSPEWGQAYLAIQRAGGTVVPLDRLQHPAEWLDVLMRSGATRLFVAHAEGERLRSHAGEQGSVLQIYSLSEPLVGASSLEQLVARNSTATLPSVSRDGIASLIFTSGTTGRSKGVMLAHESIVANAIGMLNFVGLDGSTDRFLSVLPMSHCYECTCGFVAPLLAGAPVYYARGLAPREVVADLQRSGATFLLGVPLLFEKINEGIQKGLEKAGFQGRMARLFWSVSLSGRALWKHRLGRALLGGVRAKAGLGSMRFLVSGGAPLPVEVGRRFEALGVQLLQGYGLTETSPVVTLNPPADANPASVGLPLPGVEVNIHEPGERGDGEVRVRSITVMSGYWEDSEGTRAVLKNGWFCTGDLGRFDQRGHLYITGRLKNLIISPGGKNISPEEIESAALRCGAVSEIMVYGRPTESGSGEEVCARVFPNLEYVAQAGWPVTEPEKLLPLVRAQIEAATQHLAAYKRIVHYELTLDPFEKTTTQKIKRFAVRSADAPLDRAAEPSA